MTDLIHRPRRLRKSAALRAMFEETTLSLNDLVLPIFVEEELDDYKAIDAMPGVMRIPEKQLAREIERIANAGIRSVMTFGISHHTDDTGSDTLADREAARDEENAIMALVDNQIGHFGRPAHVWFVSQLPKTRSGKMLRRTIQAICEGRDPGDLTTIDDPASLQQIRQAIEE